MSKKAKFKVVGNLNPKSMRGTKPRSQSAVLDIRGGGYAS